MQKNIFLFYIVRALFLPYLWIPVLYIYLTTNKGFDPAQAALLLSLQEFLLIFLEVPTGVIADKISRKFSVGLGYILAALPFLFLPMADQFYMFVLLFAVKAVGKALISGADTSLLYDTLVDLDRTKEYKKILNISKSLMMGVAATCIFLGGIISHYGSIDLTFILSFPLAMIGATAAFLMNEPETSRKAKVIQDRNYLLHTINSFTFITRRKTLLLLVVMLALTEGAAVNMKWYYSPIFVNLGFDLLAIGGVTTALYAAKSLSAAVGSKLLKHDQNARNVVVFSLVTALAFVLSAVFFVPVIVVMSLLLVILLTESLMSIFHEEIHRTFESHNRATAMSIVNVAVSLTATLTLNSFGLIQLHAGIQAALIFLATTFVATFVVGIRWKNTR